MSAWRSLWAMLLAAAALLVAPAAHATITCTLAVNSISVVYNPTTPLTSSAFYTITCTRTSLSDGPVVNYTLWANNGLQPQGQTRQVANGASVYKYDLYHNSGFGPNDQWGTPPPNSREIVGALGFNSGMSSTTTGGVLYYIQLLPQTAGPPGIYTDTVTATLNFTSSTNNGSASVPFNVNVTSIGTCIIAAPANLVFNYTSFQGGPATPSVNFTVNCSTGTPYTLALDNVGPITDNAVNLTYTLGLSAAAGIGAGVDQTYQVTGNMAGGQAGVCGAAFCTNAAATNKTRTITVTY